VFFAAYQEVGMLFATGDFHYRHSGSGYDAQTTKRQKGDADLFALRRVIPAAFRALFRIVFLSLLFTLVAGGITLGVAYVNTPKWPPSVLTIVAAAVIAVLAGYAAGLTTLVREVIRGLKDAERDVVHRVESEVSSHEGVHA
jgi:hypothetical protein